MIATSCRNVEEYFLEIRALEVDFSPFESILSLVLETLKAGNNVAFIGNGGSLAIADHAACDFMKSLATLKSKGFESSSKIFSLVSQSSLLSASNNDVGHEYALAWLVENYLNSGDLLVAISSSGNSSNILNAVGRAREIGISTIGFSGFPDNQLKSLVRNGFCVGSLNYGVIEDFHSIACHAIAQALSNI